MFHVEVHSRDRQVEHYLCPAETRAQAIDDIDGFYRSKGVALGNWESPEDRDNPLITHFIFGITEVDVSKPVIYISGEYRPAYPI